MPFKRLRLALLALIFANIAMPALAADETIYQGVAGDAPVVMKLSRSGAEAYGEYFYVRSRFDIDLSGAWQGQTLALTSRLTGDKIALVRSGAGFSGTLTTVKGRTLPVTLRTASPPAALPADLPKDIDLYGRLKLVGLTLTADRAEVIDGKAIRWYREPKSGLRLFRLEHGYPASAMAAMNRTLAQDQWGQVLAFFGCPGTADEAGLELAESDAPYLGGAYVSYVWRASWSCAGAAHPDFGEEGHTFDARTGRELSLDELLPVGGKPAPAKDSDGWYAYRGEVFAPAVVALLTRHHPAEMARPKSEDDCDYSDPEVWDFPSWTVSAKGLWLGASFARVMRACDSPDWAVIPWSALPAARSTAPAPGPVSPRRR